MGPFVWRLNKTGHLILAGRDGGVSMAEPLLFAKRDGIATLTLNRPDVGNAINTALIEALAQASVQCERDASIRCVVLTGAGRLFCVGGDIGVMQTASDNGGAAIGQFARTLHVAVARLARMNKPLLCVVNGPAAGMGLSLAILGDVVLAAKSAHFTTAYGAIGLTPDGGMTWLLPRLIGLRRAQEMIVLNKRVSAEEGEAIGLVTRMVDDDELAAESSKIALQLRSEEHTSDIQSL